MRILAIALCFLLASCGVVNQQAVMPEERHSGASDEEAVIMVVGVLMIDFCVIWALCHGNRN